MRRDSQKCSKTEGSGQECVIGTRIDRPDDGQSSAVVQELQQLSGSSTVVVSSVGCCISDSRARCTIAIRGSAACPHSALAAEESHS